jgi:hypothetical protein
MLSILMLGVVILSVSMLSVVMQSVFIQSVFIQSVITQSVFIVFMLSDMLGVVRPYCYAKYPSDKCVILSVATLNVIILSFIKRVS